MADYSVLDSNSNLVLESTLKCWIETQPMFDIAIRGKAQKGTQSRAQAQVQVPVFMMNDLIANLADPNNHGVIQVNDRLNGNSTIGRFNYDFTIANPRGNSKVTLTDVQWVSTIEYFRNLTLKATEIKTIGKCVRMHIINLLRQVGLDVPVNGMFKTTSWYDYDLDSVEKYENKKNGNVNNSNTNRYNSGNGNNNNYNPNYSQNYNPSHVDDASYMGTHSGFNPNGGSRPNMVHPDQSYPAPSRMPEQPASNNTQQQSYTQRSDNLNPVQQRSNTGSRNTIPTMGSPLPPMSNMGGIDMPIDNSIDGYTSNFQDMLSNTFSNQVNSI